MGDRPADGPPAADLEVPDQRRHPGQQRHRRRHLDAGLDGGLGRAGADPHVPVAALDAPHPGDAADVDQVVEHGQPQGQHGDQALAAGEDLGAVAELGEQLRGLGGRRGGVIGERRGLHVTRASQPSRRRRG
jgi:hypothetical protein